MLFIKGDAFENGIAICGSFYSGLNVLFQHTEPLRWLHSGTARPNSAFIPLVVCSAFSSYASPLATGPRSDLEGLHVLPICLTV